jgi:WXXGXW repeat (2 copies)
MLMRRLAQWMGTVGLGLVAQACVLPGTTPVNSGYGYSSGSYASASLSVGQPSPYYVGSAAPEPLYEQMSASPGYGFVWIDGYWHWNGYEWVWVRGRWTRQQEGYVYVQPYYDYSGSQYVYQPGYWSQPNRVPRGWEQRNPGSGRPPLVVPPPVRNPPPVYNQPPVYNPPTTSRPPVVVPPPVRNPPQGSNPPPSTSPQNPSSPVVRPAPPRPRGPLGGHQHR